MAIHYRTPGFILKKDNRGEADQLFVIYTKDFGKLEVLGKAIRKIKSKLRSGTELFYLSEIEFIQGKAYKTLTDALVIKKFKNIRQNLEKLEVAYQIAIIIDSLLIREEKDENIWCLINEVFDKLENANSLKIIYYYFLWNLMVFLGYQIDLYHCAVCQKKLSPQKLYFDAEENGVIDSSCFQKEGEPASAAPSPKLWSVGDKASAGKEISPETIKILRLFLKKDWDTLTKLKIGEDHKKNLEAISENYLSHYTNK